MSDRLGKKLVRLTLVSIVCLLFLSACVPYNQTLPTKPLTTDERPLWTSVPLQTETAQTIGEKTKRDQTVIIATDRLVDGWMSPVSVSKGQVSPLNFIYEPLLRYDPASNNYKAAFVNSWRVTGNSLVIEIDPAKRWHDETEASLADVIYSLELYQRLQVDPLLKSMILKVDDEHHLTLSFAETVTKAEISYVFSRLLIIPRHIFVPLESQLGENIERANELSDFRLIGSGPYKLRSLDEFAVLLERTSTEDKLPLYIEIPRYGDTGTRQRALTAGQADLWYGTMLDDSHVQSLASNETIYSIWLNGTSKKLENQLVRQAIGRAFRRILVSARFDIGDKYYFRSYQYFGSQETASRLNTDLATTEPRYASSEVVELMQSAGKDFDDRGFYRLGNDEDPLELIYVDRPGVQPSLEQFTLEVRSQGFNVRMVALDEGDFLKRREALDYDLIFDAYPADDREAAIERRVRDALRHIRKDFQAPAVSRIEAALSSIYDADPEKSMEAKSVLALEIQRLAVIYVIDSAPEAYLNLNKSVWTADLKQAAGSPPQADPFGPNWQSILEALKPKQ